MDNAFVLVHVPDAIWLTLINDVYLESCSLLREILLIYYIWYMNLSVVTAASFPCE